jgi:cytochrome c oxidase subunit III
MGDSKSTKSIIQKLENLHPYEMLLYLGMFSSGLIFLFLTGAFLSSGLHQLSGSASKMRLSFQEEKISQLESSLRNTFFLGLAFTVLQFAGWKELQQMGVSFTGIPSGSFLYVLSGIHIFHLLGAMVFGLILLFQLRKTQEDGVRKLILVTNPFEKMRIRLFTVYWHFMDGVWLVLFLIFILSF